MPISFQSCPKVLWGVFFGALLGVLLLAQESVFSNRIQSLFYTLQDSFVAWLEQSPEKSWLIVGAILPSIFMVLAAIGYLSSKSDRWQELFIKAFVALATASLAFYGAFITDIAGWGK